MEVIDFSTPNLLKHACRIWAVKQAAANLRIQNGLVSNTRYIVACKRITVPHFHLHTLFLGLEVFFPVKAFVSECVLLSISIEEQLRDLYAFFIHLFSNYSEVNLGWILSRRISKKRAIFAILI